MSLFMESPTYSFDHRLAVAIGLRDAVVLGCVEYWLKENKNNPKFQRDGFTWCKKTLEQWQQVLPYLSLRTVGTVIASLEGRGLLRSTSKYNEHPTERTKWYAIDRMQIEALKQAHASGEPHAPAG